MSNPESGARPRGWRERWRVIIFEADTPAGKLFDVALLVAIVTSVGAVVVESVADLRSRHGPLLYGLEWGFTVLFTVEYALRLAVVQNPARYARSFFGIVDLLATLPTYMSLLFTGTQSLIVIRALRLLRVFRVFKMARYLGEVNVLMRAMRASRRKIAVFLGVVLTLVVIIGTLMYLVEGADSGFTSIPKGIYWAIVTLTTVGYGDLAPQSPLGQLLASAVMLTGYGIIAVPTGIVTSELVFAARQPVTTRACPACTAHGHDDDALHCKICGARLAPPTDASSGPAT